jgi:hypothetical protein
MYNLTLYVGNVLNCHLWSNIAAATNSLEAVVQSIWKVTTTDHKFIPPNDLSREGYLYTRVIKMFQWYL